VVRIVQRGYNSIATDVRGRGCRSVVSDRNTAQTSGGRRGRGGLRQPIVGRRQVTERERRRPVRDGQGAGGVGSCVIRIVQRGDNRVAADVGRRRCRSIVGNGDTAQTGRSGRHGNRIGRSVVGLRQVAERERRRPISDGQRAGRIGSRPVGVAQRGDNRVAADVGRRGGRSIVGNGDTAQTGRFGRGGNRLGRPVVGLGQVAKGERRRSLADRQGAAGAGSRVVRVAQRGLNVIAAEVGGRG